MTGSASIGSVGRLGGQRQRVQIAIGPVHLALERCIDGALLLHAVHALERGVDHLGRVMVPVAGQIGDGDAGLGKGGADQLLDFLGLYRHRRVSFVGSVMDVERERGLCKMRGRRALGRRTVKGQAKFAAKPLRKTCESSASGASAPPMRTASPVKRPTLWIDTPARPASIISASAWSKLHAMR